MCFMTDHPTPDRSEPKLAPEWHGAAYAANTAHHRRYDDDFLAATPLRPGIDLVDLGCGSGDFTRRLADLVAPGTVLGVDPSSELLDHARRGAAANQDFVLGTAQRLDELVGDRRFRGVISRAALHWVPDEDQARVVRNTRSILEPGGWLRVEMGGAGNIAAVVDLLNRISAELHGPVDPWCFPDPGRVLGWLEDAGFELATGWVRSVAQRRTFDRAGLIGWLESQVLNAYHPGLPGPAREEFSARALGSIDRLRRSDGSYDQTFVRVDLLAWRSDSEHRVDRG
jgi:trans-aconitate 2-methyltransferase